MRPKMSLCFFFVFFLWAPLCSISSTAIVLSLQGYKIQSNGTRRRHVFGLKIEQGRKKRKHKGLCLCGHVATDNSEKTKQEVQFEDPV